RREKENHRQEEGKKDHEPTQEVALRKGQALGTADSESFALLRDRGLTQTGGSRALGDVTVGYSELRSVARAQDRPVMDLV
ncbi:hypothetical protein, partial [Bacillus paralicheniformis]